MPPMNTKSESEQSAAEIYKSTITLIFLNITTIGNTQAQRRQERWFLYIEKVKPNISLRQIHTLNSFLYELIGDFCVNI